MRSDPSRERGNAALAAVVLFLVVAGIAAWLLLGMQAPERAVPLPSATPTSPTPTAAEPIPAVEPAPATTSAPAPAPAATETAPATESSPATPLRGRVVTPEGGPIEGASVRILTGLPADLESSERDLIQIYVAGEVLLLPAELGTPTELAERVHAAAVVRTGADGSFEFPLASESEAWILISAAGYAPQSHSLTGTAEDPRYWKRTLQKLEGELARDFGMRPGTAGPGDYTLTPATLIRGTVLSSTDGIPAVGVDVHVAAAGDGPFGSLFGLDLDDGPRGRVNESGEYGVYVEESGDRRVGARSGASDFSPLPIDQWVRVIIERGDAEHRVDLRVAPGGVVEGRLLSAARLPIGDAEIRVFPELDVMAMSNAAALGELEPREAELAANGEFRAGGLPLGRAYRVSVRAEGHANANALTTKLDASSPTAWVEITLERGSTISGHVLTEAGAPAAGVSVRLFPDFSAIMQGGLVAATSAFVEPARTEEDGAFTLENVTAGKYRLSAGEEIPEMNPFGEQTGEPVEVDGVNDIAGLVLVASPEDAAEDELAGDLTGIVVDGEGRPLSGVAIVLGGGHARNTRVARAMEGAAADPAGASEAAVAAAAADSELQLVTDANGSFTAPGWAASGVFVRASLPGYSDETEFLGAGETEVEIVLEAVGTIRGRVTIAGGAPPSVPFRVSADRVGAAEDVGMEANIMRMMGVEGSDGEEGEADGTFELEEIPIGAVEVVARAPGFAPARSRTIEVRPGALVEGIELVLTRGASIAGTVRDPDGAPLPGAKVVCLSAAAASGFGDMMAQMMPALFAGDSGVVTAADGSYEIANLEPGEYQLRAMHPSFARSEAVTVALGAEQTKSAPAIALLRGGIIEGKVERAGEPVAGIMIQAFSGSTIQQGMSDASGAFRFENLPEGEFSLIFMNLAGMMKPGGGTGIRSRTAQVAPGETVRVELEFGTGKTVSGVVEPVPPGQMKMVTLRRPGGPAPEEIDPLDMAKYAESSRYQVGVAMLGPDGKFAIDDVEPGEYILEVPAMPDDPTDLEAYAAMDRTPLHRRTITVGDSDQHVMIRLD